MGRACRRGCESCSIWQLPCPSGRGRVVKPGRILSSRASARRRSRRLDELILELRASLGSTVVVVTHELASIFTIGNNSVFLAPETKTMIAQGDPKVLRDTSPDPKVREFLTRGEAEVRAP
jgi:hypothetical protein